MGILVYFCQSKHILTVVYDQWPSFRHTLHTLYTYYIYKSHYDL